MSDAVLQAQYEALAQIAKRFAQQRTAVSGVQQQVRRRMDVLSHSWQGKGADAFQREMQGEVLPALHRLSEALGHASKSTQEISALLQQAEEEAAAIFKGQQQGTKSAKKGLWDRFGEWVHGGLDVLGLVPGFGEVADGINGLIYLAEGRKLEAGLSFAAMIPFAGWGATAGKVGVRATRAVAKEGAERVAREGAERVVREGAEEGAERAAREGAERAARDAADPPATVTIKNGHKSVQDPTFLKYGELAPNSSYTRNGYDYATDAQGRVTQASGQLRLEDYPRYKDYETKIGHQGIDGDQGGHLIGNRFGGTSEGVNLVPQNGNFNTGAYNQLERQWADEIRAGNRVDVRVGLSYADNTGRPSRYQIEYTVTNPTTGESTIRRRTFFNNPGGRP